MNPFRKRLSEALRTQCNEASGDESQKAWVYETAEKLNLHDRTLREYLYGRSEPSSSDLIAMFRLFGPDFANAMLELAEITVIKPGGNTPVSPNGQVLKRLAATMRAVAADLDEAAE